MRKVDKRIEGAKEEIIKLLSLPEYQAMSTYRIAEIIEKDQSRVSRHISDLEDWGYVSSKNSKGQTSLKRLTREGFEVAGWVKNRIGGGAEGGDALDIRLHRFFFKYPIRNSRRKESSEWIEKALKDEPVRTRYDPETDSYRVFTEEYHVRVTRSNVLISISDMYGSDVENLKNRAMVQGFEARDWISDKIEELELQSSPESAEIWVNEQHVAILRDPFAELVASNSSVDLSEVKICDSDGNVRLKMDQSTDVPELESENLRHGENDIKMIKKHYEQLIENPGLASRMRQLPSIVTELSERVAKLEEKLEKGDSDPRTALAKEIDADKTWVDNGGNLVGYNSDLEKRYKILDSKHM